MRNQITQWHKRAKFFETVFPLLEKGILKKHEKLVDLNCHLKGLLLDLMDITTHIKYSSSFENPGTAKNGRLIEICKHFGTDVLYDGNSDQNFIDLERFRQEGIEVFFSRLSAIALSTAPRIA